MSENERDHAFENLLIYLKNNRGFDFTGYKRSSLERRVSRRMSEVRVDSFEAYQDYLEVHPREFEFLFNTILINVTAFFRDRPAWDYLAAEIVPRILKAREPGEDIRVWSAGCASGEEAYSVAMVLAEALGLEEARRRGKIYATDVDEVALTQARQGVYSAKEVESVPERLLEKYFLHVGGGYLFDHDLRRNLVFGRHDLMQDAPISRLDLLVCRNTLIYFNREAQKRIVANFHFALRDTGYLFLGKAEMLLTYADLFAPEDVKHRVFGKMVPGRPRRELLTLGEVEQAEDGIPEATDGFAQLQQMAFATTAAAQVVVDRDGILMLANDRARTDFGVDVRDLGRPFQDLQVSYRPLELRSLIDRVRDTGRAFHVEDVERSLPEGESEFLDVHVAPLKGSGGRWLGIAVSFVDVTQRHRLRDELKHAKQETETAYEELQSTNEELETSNEELQSTVEELQTTNEELQSTNEEMETLNEELQSTNEELQTMNDELSQRTTEADRAKAFLESVVASLDAGVVAVGRDFKVLLWNNRAEELWGLRAEEVLGCNLMDLDIGLPVEELRKPLEQTLVKGTEAEVKETVLEAINRRGKPIHLRVTPTLRLGSKGEVEGLVLWMAQGEG
jgi:two-component system, chemotaxis family, CheB/CheR fusion protein